MIHTLHYFTSLIATILGLYEPFGKRMQTILTLNFLGNLFVGISYLLVTRYSGAAICFTACVQVLINYCYERKNKKLPTFLLILHLLAFLTVNLVTFIFWYDILALIASVLYVLSVAQSSAKYYRVFYVTNSLVWIFYDLLAGAYGNLFTHVVLFAVTMVAIFVRDLRAKHYIGN